MPNLLGVTNPVPGHDSSNINRSLPVTPGDPRIQNAADPSRVSRPDNRTERQDSGDSTGPGGALRYDSNFQAFLQKLVDTPALRETLYQILTENQSIVSSGMDEGVSGEISALMEMLKMDEGQLLTFLTKQLGGGSRFSGPLFTLLREAYAQSQSEGVRNDILQFLKRYGDYTSSQHIEGNLMRTLTRLSGSIPATYGNQLLTMIQKLEQHFASADRAGAMKLLQGTILPFLAGYTEKTHDMGLPRSLISLLALDISRYENGSEEGLLQAFRQLGAHGTLRTRLSGLISDEALLRYIQNTDFVRGPQENHFANQLMATAMRALSGEAGVEKQEAFRQILSAFLINESVYMPLNHTIIPMNWNGKLMFSELWVDPDAEGNLRKGGSEKDNTIRFLFKIDIQGLGFFDMVLGYRKDVVELLISCPEQVASHGTIVQRELVRILEENGLKSNGVQIQKMNRALTISAVFPKIFEGEKSINVKV